MSRLFSLGGVLASAILIAFGIGAIVIGISGRAEVRDRLAQERIVGSADMEGIANKPIETGADAKKFAEGMREHTLADTGGRTYAQMGRYVTESGEETNDEAQAAKNPDTGAPMPNQARNIWVTETALATALNTSFFAEQVALFAIVMGAALLLTGIGFLVLTLGVLRRMGSARAAMA